MQLADIVYAARPRTFRLNHRRESSTIRIELFDPKRVRYSLTPGKEQT